MFLNVINIFICSHEISSDEFFLMQAKGVHNKQEKY